MIEILPTCVPRGRADVLACVDAVRAFAPSIHADVDDGAFTPITTWPYKPDGTLDDSIELPPIPIEIHLMVEEPLAVGNLFARAGAKRIIAHVEGFADKREILYALDAWKGKRCEVGLGLLYHTAFEVVEPLIMRCDVVHLMSIATVGVQGIPYVPEAPARIAEFHARFPHALISVDGGVSEQNIAQLALAGARRFGIGTAIFKASDPAAAYKKLLALAEDAIQ